MARLNDENLPDAEGHSSDHILSPQPCAPPSKELLLNNFEPDHLPSNAGSTIDDGQLSTQSYEYSSGSSTRHSISDVFGREMDDDLEQMKSRASSRSSFSSVPASVLIHPVDQMKQLAVMGLPEQDGGYSIEADEASFGGFDRAPQSIRTIRQREAAFRKPSSVRAMQMHTEDEADDDEFLTPPRRRAGMRSPGTSPLKRSPYYSPKASQRKPSVKKEYPLVLLHCTLLAPSLPVAGAAEPQNQKIVEEVLPPQYWKRWRRLQDKVGSGVLRERGVLISHPEDLYDILEERLLESLELKRPLLHRGHYLGHEEGDPGSEGEVSDRDESETDGEQGDECPDCGGRVLNHSDNNRKWEIRVYAANGLMRAGAWAAAWKEMEKVDVEVGVWLPSDVRRALEKRLADEQANVAMDLAQLQPTMTFSDAGTLNQDPRRMSIQTHSRTFSDAGSLGSSGHRMESSLEKKDQSGLSQAKQEHQIALRTLIINYIRVLAGDRRNMALLFMSVLVIFFAMSSHSKDRFQEVLHRSVHESFFEPPVRSKADVHADVPSLSMTSSSTSLVESLVPTSTAMASIQVGEPVVSSHTEETQVMETNSMLAEPESVSPNPQPTPDVETADELFDVSREEFQPEFSDEATDEFPEKPRPQNLEDGQDHEIMEARSIELSEQPDPVQRELELESSPEE